MAPPLPGDVSPLNTASVNDTLLPLTEPEISMSNPAPRLAAPFIILNRVAVIGLDDADPLTTAEIDPP